MHWDSGSEAFLSLGVPLSMKVFEKPYLTTDLVQRGTYSRLESLLYVPYCYICLLSIKEIKSKTLLWAPKCTMCPLHSAHYAEQGHQPCKELPCDPSLGLGCLEPATDIITSFYKLPVGSCLTDQGKHLHFLSRVVKVFQPPFYDSPQAWLLYPTALLLSSMILGPGATPSLSESHCL